MKDNLNWELRLKLFSVVDLGCQKILDDINTEQRRI